MKNNIPRFPFFLFFLFGKIARTLVAPHLPSPHQLSLAGFPSFLFTFFLFLSILILLLLIE